MDVVLLSVYFKSRGKFVGFFCDILITNCILGGNSSFLAVELDVSPIFSLPPFKEFCDLRVTGHLGGIFPANAKN
jgi:hypothetical protein